MSLSLSPLSAQEEIKPASISIFQIIPLHALAISEKQLGANHPRTGGSLNNLAELYESQGRYAEAEPLYLRALAIREKQLGADHAETGTSLNNLGGLYRTQGRHEEAEPLYRRAVGIFVGALGAQHPNSISVIQNHTTLLREMGRLEAELPSLPPEYRPVLEQMKVTQ